MPTVAVKGKQQPVLPFLVKGGQIESRRTKQLKGVRADLVGRTKELLKFSDAAARLKSGQGSVICLSGTAGSGKSRLVEEFKASTSLLWLEGFTYPYTQNTPYFPIITLFNHAMDIKEEDSSETLRKKIEGSIRNITDYADKIIPYIGVLYSLDYPDISNVSPEFYKTKLFDAILTVVNAIAVKTPTIICIEDLHWADPSSLELIRHITGQINIPAIILTITRPVIELFSGLDIETMPFNYLEIQIDDLSAAEAKTMVKSLLKTNTIPKELEGFVETKAQGNPFYLEEIINSLIESGTLEHHEKGWQLNGQISQAQISGSIHNVISSRIDRLETQSRKIIQEASVIGRSFYHKIINRITETQKDIHHCLETLENLDLIKSRQTDIDLEYVFKHALTQEVVYNGLLKTQRRVIHEKIATVIEEVFHDRLPEFYETLAHHFSKGDSTIKAVDYLIKSGEKSLKRYSLDEAHDYFQSGYDLIRTIPDPTPEIEETTMDLLNRWALVYYYHGTFKNLETLLFSNAYLTEGKKPNETLGMFYAWQGFILVYREQFENSEAYLKKALEVGEQIKSSKVTGYACAWLSFTCSELGKFHTAIEYAQQGYEIGKNLKTDPYITFKSLGAMGWNYFWTGQAAACLKAGEEMVAFGKELGQTRSIALGYTVIVNGHSLFGDFTSATEKAIQGSTEAVDPYYKSLFPMALAYPYILQNKFQQATDCLDKFMPMYEKNGDLLSYPVALFEKSITMIGTGKMTQGFSVLTSIEKKVSRQNRKGVLPLFSLSFGRIYLEMILQTQPVSTGTILKNIGFIFKNLPFAFKKACFWYEKAIKISEELGAIGIKAQALMDLGLLYKAKNQTDKARQHLEDAIALLEKVGALAYLKKAKKELDSLN